MSELIELVYASRSNVVRNRSDAGVEPEIGRILTQSRRNNEPLQIGGVLTFGNGTFFQCLEGERQAVEALYEKLHGDPRHRDVKLLRKGPIQQRRFKLWAMKYLSLDEALNGKLKKHGLEEFDPFRFDDQMIDDVLEVLRESTEAPRSPGNRPQPNEASSRPMKVYAVAAAAAVVALTVLVWNLL
jgi:hypothetical protein